MRYDNYLVGLGVGTCFRGFDGLVGDGETIPAVYLDIDVALHVANLVVAAHLVELHFLVFPVRALAPEDAVVAGIHFAVLFVIDSEATAHFGISFVVA